MMLARFRTLRKAYICIVLVRTTLNLNDELAQRAKEAALRERTTLTRLIEEGLRMRLRAKKAAAVEPLDLPVFDGKTGMRPGIDPRSNRSLFDAADGVSAEDA